MPRFAANLSFLFADRALPDRIDAARAAGFDAVEMLFPYEHAPETLAEWLKAADLELVLFNMRPGDWAAGERGLASFPHRSEEFRASVEEALRYAQRLGTRRLHALAGLAQPDDARAASAYRDALAFACDRAGPMGVDVLIEPINGRDMPGYHLASFERAAEIIAALGRPNLKLQFDVYHRQILRGDVIRGLEELMPLIGHVQVASVPGRNEPGTGELDDFAVFAALDRLGYAGFVGCEYRPLGRTEDGLGWMDRAAPLSRT
ncbi:2-oxo-tetronate isomerase [Chenggangzhangella methanolivorans]|uniref:TIM barrel protein n=1 Tax=Chenggangzhangella methanolivorans TaxID=1437009 RepID=A0A9E6UNG6_9HYPH|nr:2-oxo-tetronate isomerase [Chenggangzhangella methanolivorans]QZO00169.1 TIM barrel protein [Chenggangzhangella methanolivorans]